MDDLDDIFIITEVDRGPAIANHIFRRKCGADLPDFDHHVVAFYRKAEDHLVPASYLHLWLRDEVCLVGGGCTDGRALAQMHAADRARVRPDNSLLLHTLRYSFRRYADRCDAFFGYCGDARAWEVDRQAGFVPTPHRYLIAHWHRPLAPARQDELIERVHGFGAF